MNGALCICNHPGNKVINVAIRQAGTDDESNPFRPLAIYSAARPDADPPTELINVAIDAPGHNNPLFINQSKVNLHNVTVNGANTKTGSSGAYIGQWPWGGRNTVTFENSLFSGSRRIAWIEKNAEVSFDNTLKLGIPDPINISDEDTSLIEEGSFDVAPSELTLADKDGFILYPSAKTYGCGWIPVSEGYKQILGYNLRGTGNIAVEGGRAADEVWKQTYFSDYYLCGSGVYGDDYLYVANDPSPSATIVKVSLTDGTVSELCYANNWDNGAPALSEDGYLYQVDCNAVLYKFEAETGSLVWSNALPVGTEKDRACSSGVKLAYGKIYVKVSTKGLVCADAETGNVVWVFEDADSGDGWGGSGVNFDEFASVVYYNDPNKVNAVNTADGTLAWSYTGASDLATSREPIVALDGTIFVQTRGDSSKVIALNPDGSVKWNVSQPTKTGDDGGLSLSLDETVLYTSTDGGVCAFATEDGTLNWEAKIGHVHNTTVPILEGGLYAVTEGTSGEAVVYLKDNGDSYDLVWSKVFDTDSASCHFRPVVLPNGNIIAASPNTMVCYAPNNTAPINDNLADAIAVTFGTTNGDNKAATVEEGENAEHKASVWYFFTATEDGGVLVSDKGSFEVSGFDGVLSIYSTSEVPATFESLTPIVESQDIGEDETFGFVATSNTTYYICWSGSNASQGAFTMTIEAKHPGDYYIAPGATGSGTSPDDPSGDLTEAMNSVFPGQSVNLASGAYSIQDFNNSYYWYADGMTALVFNAEGVSLVGAGPDKTIIVVPNGYAGIRLDKNGCSLQNLTIYKETAGNCVNPGGIVNKYYNGTVTLADADGLLLSNVCIYSEQAAASWESTGSAHRPLAGYRTYGDLLYRVAVVSPNYGSPIWFTLAEVDFTYVTVQPLVNDGDIDAFGFINYPWYGGPNTYTLSNILTYKSQYPFRHETVAGKPTHIIISDSFLYGTTREKTVSRISGDKAENYVDDDTVIYTEDTDLDPKLALVGGYYATAQVPGFEEYGWHTAIPETPSAMLGYTLQGGGALAVDGDKGYEEVWSSDYFADGYICGSAVSDGNFIYLANDPSPNATVLRISVADGTVEEWLTEDSWDNGAPLLTEEGFLYVADESATVYKFNYLTKDLVWKNKLPISTNKADRLCSTAVKMLDGNLYIQVAENGLYSVASSSGSVNWVYADPDCADNWGGNGVSFSPDGAVVYYKDATKVVAVNTADGTLAWTANTNANDTNTARNPIVGQDGSVYALAKIGTAGALFVYDDEGNTKFAAATPAAVGDDGGLALSLEEDVIFVSHSEGVTAYTTEDGTELWTAEIGHVRNCVIPIYDGGVYAVSEGEDGSYLNYLINGGEDSVELVWSYQISDKNESCHIRPLALEDGSVFCGTPTTISLVKPVVPEPAFFGLLALLALFLRRK